LGWPETGATRRGCVENKFAPAHIEDQLDDMVKKSFVRYPTKKK
jgi:hypothetical protein